MLSFSRARGTRNSTTTGGDIFDGLNGGSNDGRAQVLDC